MDRILGPSGTTAIKNMTAPLLELLYGKISMGGLSSNKSGIKYLANRPCCVPAITSNTA